jgi:hypothetical protein
LGNVVDAEDDGGGREDVALPPVPAHIGRDLTLYVLARFALVTLVGAALMLAGAPLLIGLAAGLVIGLPLSMVLLRGWHAKIARGLAARGAVRRAQRDRLRSELRGETPELPGLADQT